jgi:hypothetical protein
MVKDSGVAVRPDAVAVEFHDERFGCQCWTRVPQLVETRKRRRVCEQGVSGGGALAACAHALSLGGGRQPGSSAVIRGGLAATIAELADSGYGLESGS